MEENLKKLLSIDLCARLPYNVKYQFTLKYGDNCHKEGVYLATITTFDGKNWLEVEYNDTSGASGKSWMRDWSCSLDDIKPYLRPLSSMSDYEIEELYKAFGFGYMVNNFKLTEEWQTFKNIIMDGNLFIPYPIWIDDFQNGIKYLLENHFDYQGLIPKNLAIKVTEENNPYKVMEE